jgi:3-dehydroquinate dehydratase/shikimate dehydrogenase
MPSPYTLDAAKDVPAMLAACPVPCIVTYRPTWEGGQYGGEEEPRLAALWTAVEAGAAYVDCELLAAERFFAAAPEGVKEASSTKIILSNHHYDKVPSDDELADIHARCVAGRLALFTTLFRGQNTVHFMTVRNHSDTRE